MKRYLQWALFLGIMVGGAAFGQGGWGSDPVDQTVSLIAPQVYRLGISEPHVDLVLNEENRDTQVWFMSNHAERTLTVIADAGGWTFVGPGGEEPFARTVYPVLTISAQGDGIHGLAGGTLIDARNQGAENGSVALAKALRNGRHDVDVTLLATGEDGSVFEAAEEVVVAGTYTTTLTYTLE